MTFAQKRKPVRQPNTSNTTVQTDTVKVDYKSVGSSMPPFRMVTMKGKSVTGKDLQNDANLFVMIFNPFCEHCGDQAELFKQDAALFKQSKLVLITASTMMPNLEYFENTHPTAAYTAIITGVDSSGFIDKTFLYNNLPQINIYDKDRKLLRVFTGDVPMDSLKAYIE